jgi:hypothetical protein
MAFQHDDGTLTPVSCGCPNLCRYCSWLVALENAVVVKADSAMCLPRVGFTLTTKAATTPPATFRKDVEQVFRALRREPWAKGVRYLGQIEFTTGEGTRSGGARRIHQHGLLKDVEADRAADVAELSRRVWLPRTGAHRVEAHELHRPAGAIAYLINHHAKTAQTPPRGWSGKRLRPSKGYYERPIGEMREEARAFLSDKRARAATERLLCEANSWDELPDVDEIDEVIERSVEAAREHGAPVLVRTQRVPVDFGPDGLPTEWATEVVGLVEDERAA